MVASGANAAPRRQRAVRTTSFDIAYRAGVSQPTVSRALRGDKVVSEATRKRIEAIAHELNYRVDRNASALRRQQVDTLALLIFQDPTPDDSLINPFFLSMLGSITRACTSRGYDLLISFQQLSTDWHRDYEESRRADGIILLGYGDYLAHRVELAKQSRRMPHLVRWGAHQSGQPEVSVGCDNALGGFEIVRHLIGLGRRRIAFLGNASSNYPEFLGRFHGYVEAHQAAGLAPAPGLQIDAMFTESAGYEAARELVRRGTPFDAVFAASDLMAIGAIRALQECGLRVPKDVAVAGFDDIPTARFTNPPLTTVSQDINLAGEALVKALLAQVRGEPTTSVLLQPQLVIRRSCGSPPD